MQSILVLCIAFVGLGLIFQKYDKRIRLLILLVAVSMVIYVTLK